jgi:hypothetical protein
MIVADVFVHGVGGAAYDLLTDDIVRRLTGCDPPRHAVVTGTLRLPVDGLFPGFAADDPAGELAALHHQLRDLEFHPERSFVPHDAQSDQVRELIQHKQRWIDTHPTTTLAKRRCREIRAANDRMAFHALPLRTRLLDRAGPLATAVRARKVLRSREYPWCFFSENALKSFLLLEMG